MMLGALILPIRFSLRTAGRRWRRVSQDSPLTLEQSRMKLLEMLAPKSLVKMILTCATSVALTLEILLTWRLLSGWSTEHLSSLYVGLFALICLMRKFTKSERKTGDLASGLWESMNGCSNEERSTK